MKKLLAFAIAALMCAAAALFVAAKFFATEIFNKVAAPAGIQAQKVALSPTQIEIDALEYSADFGKIDAKKIRLNYSPTALLFGKIEISDAEISATAHIKDAISKSDTPAPKTPQSPTPTADKKTSAAVKIPDIKITSALLKLNIVYADKTSELDARISDAEISPTKRDFKLDARFTTPENTRYELSAQSRGSKFSAKMLCGELEFLTANAALENLDKGELTAKLVLSDAVLKPLETALKTALPKTDAEIYARAEFDFPQKQYLLDCSAVATLTKLEKTKVAEFAGFEKIGFGAKAAASFENGKLAIGECRTELSLDGAPVATALAEKSVFDTATARAGEFVKLAKITASIKEPQIKKIRALDGFSAQSINAEIDVRADKNFAFKLRTTRQANIENASFKRDNKTVFEKFSVFADADATLDFGAQRFCGNALLQSKIVDGKRTKIEAAFIAERGTTTAKIGISGTLNPILYSINSISSNITEPLEADILADIKTAPASLEVANARAKIAVGNNGLLDVKFPKTLAFDFQKKTFSASQPIGFNASKLPFAPIAALCAGADAKTVSLNGTVEFANGGSKISAKTRAELEDFSYENSGKKLLENVGIKLDATAHFDTAKSTLSAELTKAEISGGAAAMLIGSAKADFAAQPKFALKNASAEMSAQLPAVFAQPFASSFYNLARGAAQCKATFDADANKISADFKATDISAKSDDKTLDSISAKLDAAPDNQPEIRVSVSIKSSRGNSDADFSATLAEELSAKISAKTLVLPDLLALKNAFATRSENSDAAKNTPANPRNTRANFALGGLVKKDAKAFWDIGKKFSAKATAEKLSAGETTVENLGISFAGDAKELAISDIAAHACSGKLSGAVKIKFDAAKDKPYEIEKSKISLLGFDISKLSENSVATGVFDAQAEIFGTVETAAALADYAEFTAQITGKNGGVKLANANKSVGQKITLAQTAAKLANEFLKNDSLASGVELSERLSDFAFETALLKISRTAPNFDIVIDSCELENSWAILKTESGIIRFAPDTPFKEREIDVRFALYTADSRFAKLLQNVNALAVSSDMDGFKKSETFKIFGTVANPQTNVIDIVSGAKVQQITPQSILNKIKLFK